MSVSSPEYPSESADGRPSLDELARRQGIRPIASVDELVRWDVFESDEEVDEFIAFTYAMRRAGTA